MTTSRLARLLKRVTSLILLAGLAWLVWPTTLGGEVTVLMVSGTSMEPDLHTGDLVLVRERPSYEVGDVVAFRVPEGHAGEGSIVIHRLVDGDAQAFTTMGDNRDRPDPWFPSASDVVGERYVMVPGVGHWFARLRSPTNLALLAGVLTFVAMALPVRSGKREEPAAIPLPVAPARPKLRFLRSPAEA